jgi:putative peptidoglycan lipid II flippase
MLDRFFNFQSKSISEGALILSIATLISRFLGVVREWLLASRFGAGVELDVYFTAFKIPDLLYNIFIAGGIIVAFLPIFSEIFEKNEEKAWKFTSNLLNIFLFLLILISFALFIFTPNLLKFIAPGLSPGAINQCTTLTRFLFLSPILFGLSSVFSGLLHYFNRFLIYSLSPILYNIGIILGILFFSPRFGVLGVAIGVILGAAFHFLIQLPSALGCGFRYRPVFNFRTPEIKKVFSLMLPRTVGNAAQQINFIVINAIASTLTVGSISIFNFANNIQSLPIGFMGVAFAVAAFPQLTKLQAQAKREEFKKRFLSIFSKVSYLVIPTCFLIFILRKEIVNLILRHGQFSQTSAQLTAASLGLFCLGLWSSTLIPLLLRGFFALQDTKTPTFVALLAMLINIVLSFSFVSALKESTFLETILTEWFRFRKIGGFEVLALPLAFSLSSIFQFILLSTFLFKKLKILKE